MALLTLLTGDDSLSFISFSLRFSSNFIPSILYHSRNLALLEATKLLTPNIVNHIKNRANAAHITKKIICIAKEILSGTFHIVLVSSIPKRSTDEISNSKYVSRKNLSMLWTMKTFPSFCVSQSQPHLICRICHVALKQIQTTKSRMNIEIDPRFSTKLQLS